MKLPLCTARARALGILILGLGLLPVLADDKLYNPPIAPASDEAGKVQKRIRVPAGMRVDLFAAEPMLANPVCFCVDEKNRFYVAETFRLHAGVTDIRGHMDWLDDDLACRTVADRVAMYRKRLGKAFDSFEREHDRVRLIEDTDGDGKADKATVFADGFSHAADGIGSGLLARRGNAYFACLPDLWLLRDTRNAGKADERKSLHHGFGVHVGFLGHDLHGLRMGPDGKLYFSIGDRGLNVKVGERSVACPDTGAVLRCNPDGSDLELFATGLRNPQELAFDQHGNLITCDNNADGGDQARIVYVVDGGDSGWRIGYQHRPRLGAWNSEKLWRPQHDDQAAYLVPPIANFANGPSGFTYHPGVALLPDRYKEHFFLADFRGSSGQSGIRSFALKPKGATFEMTDAQEMVWAVLATDVDFGTDGALYISDWVEGWGKPNKGRLWKVQETGHAPEAAAEVKKLLADGFTERPVEELEKLLAHADMRVRQEAQFTLVEKNAAAALESTARKHDNPLARLHGIWGLGQLGRKSPKVLEPLIALLDDSDAEVRCQSAKVLGEAHVGGAFDRLVKQLGDAQPRPRFFAAVALGKLGRPEAVTPLLEMLRANADRDRYLRHGGVMGLAGCKDVPRLVKAMHHESAAARLGVLLALRRLQRPEVARFLSDAEPRLVLEAARAIHDEPIHEAMPALAALVQRGAMPEPLWLRVLNANFRLGGAKQAAAIASAAARLDVPETARIDALQMLAEWAKPSGRDRVVGVWRPIEPRAASEAADAFRPALGGIFSGPEKVRKEAAQVAAKLGIKEVGPVLFELATDAKSPPGVRVEMLRALDAIRDGRLNEAMEKALADGDARVRAQGRRVLARLRPADAVASLEAAIDKGDLAEKQAAFETLAELKSAPADAVLTSALDKLLAKQLPAEVTLDLLEAATRRGTPALKQAVARYDATRPKTDHLAPYREALVGGDAEAGRRIFFGKTDVSCLRCHKVKGEGGEVGPDLSTIAAKQKRDYLLEAIVDPSKQIAEGFDTLVVTLNNGQTVTGVFKGEDASTLKLITPEGKLLEVPRKQIDDRQKGKSAMPEDLIKRLSKRELRDLVEFLASLK